MALTLFRRHTKVCGKTSRRYRRCSCPLHVEGSLRGEKIRKALDIISWDAGENLIREWTHAGKIGDDKTSKTVREAVEKFLTDCVARNVREGTLKLQRRLLEGQLIPFADETGFATSRVRYLSHLDTELMRDFRATWNDAPITALKKLERLRSFFTEAEYQAMLDS